ncbi:MAG: hypothetical protein REI09_05370 [Candidatus Dactylopiibacterium sp.]|nr:hypothetical protein [Candidatus Dactylopiibacterium sp.]
MNGQQWVTDIHGNNLRPMSEQNVEDVSAQKRARPRDMTEADFDGANVAEEIKPVAWMVWAGVFESRPVWPPHKTVIEASRAAHEIKSATIVKPLYSADQVTQQATQAVAAQSKQPESVADALPLSVFSKGQWLFRETGQEFSGDDLDEAAFAVYGPAQTNGNSGRAEFPDGFVRVEAFNRLQALCDSQAERLLAIDDAQPQPSGNAGELDERKLTELSVRLRTAADQHPGWRDILTSAANEIERYYGGMLYWKATAEAKDRAAAAPADVMADATHTTSCGYCTYDESDGALEWQCAKCAAIDAARAKEGGAS